VTTLDLPVRYETLSRLGKGGGGEVWAVRDKHTGERRALKVLAADASEGEMAALVREAVTLSGLEGLGVPRVLAFGRLAGNGRPYMVRELVDGRSLQELIDDRAPPGTCLEALARCAEQVTLVHRAGLLHGDIKPANVIVKEDGDATLVDLGLAAPWREEGTTAQGLTPKYAAPELLLGKPLTVRAEVYALGVALGDIVQADTKAIEPAMKRELEVLVRRATAEDPAARPPSADEFASALRRIAKLPDPDRRGKAGDVWPVVGTDGTANRLMQAALALRDGTALCLRGPEGSGRSVLLRRLSWSLGVEGRPLVFIDRELAGSAAAVRAQLSTRSGSDGVTILVDDSHRVSPEATSALVEAQRAGARLVLAGESSLGTAAEVFEVPPLGAHAAAELLRRSVPALTERLVERVIAVCGGRPGALRRFVRSVAERAIASEQDLEELVRGFDAPGPALPEDSLARATALLDRGRYKEARAALDGAQGDGLLLAIAWARLDLGLGDAGSAAERLRAVESVAKARAGSSAAAAWAVYAGRARIGLGEYTEALTLLEHASSEQSGLGAEALAYRGLALSYVGDQVAARQALDDSVARAEKQGEKRIEALAHACRGSVLQRADDTEGARAAYARAIAAAQDAGDAGVLATSQLNLAGILKISGDVAGAIEHYESAVDMGRRAGRLATVRQALLNLANLDLYLGRVARARSNIEALSSQRTELPRVAQAQLLGLEAELAARTGDAVAATRLYASCADAYGELGLAVDAAEARLEGVLAAARAGKPDGAPLEEALTRAAAELADSSAHRALLSLAQAAVGWAVSDEARARREIAVALSTARESGQRDFVWRALEARSEIEESSGQLVSARRDREEALAVLEEIATRLPRDLREVFWNDPRRRKLRTQVAESLGIAMTQPIPDTPVRFEFGSGTSSIASLSATPLEKRLARILEVNAELLGEVNLERLTARVTDHAVDMLRAERGCVLLREAGGALTVHASRARFSDGSHAEFSRSIAEEVVRTGQPVVASNARHDVRFRSFESVHHLPLESVACVPIHSRSGEAIGALYVETRRSTGAAFERELPTLRAFADQVAIALETAALIRENTDRAEQLAAVNQSLEKAQAELRELLGDRTAQLRRTRQKLRETRDTLYGHFGYQGLVGTSAAMRRVYALVDRVKDTDVPILVTGESGTGKEVAARAIHRASPRADKPFFGLNCAAVPEHLLESELFGHVRGAFTGADRERKGLFREADGGTLLLDEIGEMPPKMQTALLRVLQESMVRPVGGAQEYPVDVRLIFATHRDLEKLVQTGTFREDLFYRIHVVEVRLPPLREREEDIPPLVDHFLGIFAARYKRERASVSRDALRRLAAFSWPGNVRQLEHVLLNAWVLSEGPVLEADDFDIPDGRERSAARGDDGGERPSPRGTSSHRPGASESDHRAPSTAPRESISRHRRDERERILEALRACNWNRVQAAKLSGIPRRTFYRRLREYGIQ
jgi:transcriptional regulator with GAF, ATPase, and Fis domain/predicted Ser/Thr protein kinase